MQRIVRWSLGNKSVVILATILLIGSGVYATTRLNQELLPDISFPIITISTPVAGAGPDLVDEQVTQPVENAINGVQGIESVRSTSSQGFSVVVVEFDLDADTEEGGRVRPPGGARRHTASFAGRRSRGQEPVGFAVPYPVALAGRRGQ
jgi:hydrophobic/amphiphilic exporter-1 (mainly G- bacteria), HAE1 family